jgi:hypothetical protein
MRHNGNNQTNSRRHEQNEANPLATRNTDGEENQQNLPPERIGYVSLGQLSRLNEHNQAN